MPFDDALTVGRVPAADVRRAYDALARVDPSLSVGARQMALAIACAESNLGLFPPLVGPAGEPSHNWGAVVYTGPAQAPPFAGSPGFITGRDHDAAGNPTSVRFAAFPTMEAGAANFLRTWAKPDTRAAANAGDAHAVAAAMFGHGYYTGTCRGACGFDCPPGATAAEALALCPPAKRIAAYTNFIMGQVPKVAAALGQPIAVSRGGPIAQPASSGAAASSPALGLAGLGLLAFGAWALFTRRT